MPSPKLPGSQKTFPRECLQARMLFNYSKKSPPTLNPTFQRVLPITFSQKLNLLMHIIILSGSSSDYESYMSELGPFFFNL